jgi:hypothetical protein
MVTAVTSSLYLFWSLALPCKADYYSTASCRRAANKSKKKTHEYPGIGYTLSIIKECAELEAKCFPVRVFRAAKDKDFGTQG